MHVLTGIQKARSPHDRSLREHFKIVGKFSFPFCPSVLKPYLDLKFTRGATCQFKINCSLLARNATSMETAEEDMLSPSGKQTSNFKNPTCCSVRPSCFEISTLLPMDRYLLRWNSCSRTRTCSTEKAVLGRFRESSWNWGIRNTEKKTPSFLVQTHQADFWDFCPSFMSPQQRNRKMAWCILSIPPLQESKILISSNFVFQSSLLQRKTSLVVLSEQLHVSCCRNNLDLKFINKFCSRCSVLSSAEVSFPLQVRTKSNAESLERVWICLYPGGCWLRPRPVAVIRWRKELNIVPAAWFHRRCHLMLPVFTCILHYLCLIYFFSVTALLQDVLNRKFVLWLESRHHCIEQIVLSCSWLSAYMSTVVKVQQFIWSSMSNEEKKTQEEMVTKSFVFILPSPSFVSPVNSCKEIPWIAW